MSKKITNVASTEPIESVDQLQEEGQPVKEVASAPTKTFTQWEIFSKMGLRPKTITCQGYFPVNSHDVSCHTRLPHDASVVQRHVDSDHGGSFEFTLRQSETPWEGWRNLQELGLELLDFRCGTCLAEVNLTMQAISKHMKSHINANRRMASGGVFRFNLGYERPESAE
jgi:hypothetical protein